LSTEASTTNAGPRLRRTLTLRDLILYGIIVIQPVAPMSVFGVLSERGRGHVVTAILIALVAMLFTRHQLRQNGARVSERRFGLHLCSAGGQSRGRLHHRVEHGNGLHAEPADLHYLVRGTNSPIRARHPPVGLEGFFRHRVHPSEYSGNQDLGAHQYHHGHPYGRGCRGHFRGRGTLHPRPSARRARLFHAALLRSAYVYLWRLFGCTSIAVLTYIGFDGISTLSEEAENPRRNILLATVMTCVVIGLLSAVEVYVAQLIWPAVEKFPDLDTAYVYVAARAWKPLFWIVGCTLLLANFGSGMGAQIGAARLLYGMGAVTPCPNHFLEWWTSATAFHATTLYSSALWPSSARFCCPTNAERRC